LRNRRLTAVCQVRYQRTARVSFDESVPLRLTIDEHILATAIDAPAFSCAEGLEVLPNQAILELKCVDSPGLFRELIHDFDLAPKAVSKYRLSVECLDLVARTTMATS